MTGRGRRSDDEPSNGIGDVLGAARRGMGVSLERAAAHTHLRETYLAALERDDVDDLGLDPAYVRGTLRTYADYLGLDSVSLLARHRARVAHGAGPATASDAVVLDDRPSPRPALRIVAGVVGLVIIAVLAFVLGEALVRRSIVPFWEVSGHGVVAWEPGWTGQLRGSWFRETRVGPATPDRKLRGSWFRETRVGPATPDRKLHL